MAGNINLVDYNNTTAFWSFLIYCLVVVFVAVFFLFYAGRVFAQLLSKLIRWFTWRHLKAYIELAPLGGRILFKNFRYHSRNQSITVLHGFISFRYWLWNVRTEDEPIPEDSGFSKDGGTTKGMADKDNCRITCRLVGLEWFMYNRTPAYDILATTLGLNPDASPFTNSGETASPSVSVDMDNTVVTPDSPADNWFRRCLPVKIVCETGAIIMGNAHLPSLLVASFPLANGMYSAAKSRSSLDLYKTVLLVTFETPTIDLRPNADYNTAIVGRNMGGDVPDISRLPPRPPTRREKLARPIKALWTKYFGVSRKVAEEWHGLPRYNQNISIDNLKENKFEEYAMVRNVLQCNMLGLRYITDVAGKVPEPSKHGVYAEYDLPPEWAIELIIDEAVISYGPWADRQRAEIQNFFYPNAYRSLDPTPEAKAGEDRIHAMLQISVTFSSSATIKIPTQEKSKDWKYEDPEFQAVQGGKSMRPFGWLEMKAAQGSMITVNIPMIYGPEGYKNVVLVELQDLVLTSSVNYAPLIALKELKMACQLNNPLIWNAQRDWDFEFTMDSAKIFLLRDHITLVQDLAKDWTSGPPVEMAYFVPFKYEFDIQLPNFQLYTYILNGGLELQLPLAHTLGEFSTADSKKFAVIPSVVIKGSYDYYDFVDPSHLESLNLDVKGDGVVVKLFGNVIRYVLILMDNYAGLYLNFVTMEEYRMKRSDVQGTERAEDKQANAKPPSDPFEVYVHFTTTNTTLMLPENLYSSDNYSEITCSEIQLDLRNLDVYMGIDIYAHRLFGPLPKTTTYVANWKLDIGSIYGQIKPSFLLGVASFAKAFAYNLVDGDNAFPPEYATVTPPDITFVDLCVKEIDVSIWGEDVVSQILLKDGIIVQFDDVINERYTGRVVLKMQSLVVRSMALTEANKDGQGETDASNQDHAPWVEIASLNCAFDITVYQGAAMKAESIKSSNSIVELSSENGSMFEYSSTTSSPGESQRPSIRRSASTFSIGGMLESDSESDSGSQGPNIDLDDDLNMRYSSEDEDDYDEDEYIYPEFEEGSDPYDDEYKSAPSIPVRSIPYSSYLKRYNVTTTRSAAFRNPYLPPPRVLFSQSQTGEILEDAPKHHPYANFEEAFGTKGRNDGSISSAQPKGSENSDEKRTTIVVESTQDVKILLTPILLKIIQEFLEAINAEVPAVKYEDEEFEKFVPGKIHIASFKVVESRANVDFTKFKLNARFVSTSTARIFGIPDARHRFSRLGINHLSYLNEPVIADITFEQFKLRLVRSSNPNYFSANLEKLAVMFINQSSEIVAGSICSWLTFLKDLKTILKRFQLRRSKQLQTLFSEIARFSAQKAINTDPVFLTRPSTTLRLGTMIYRNDDGWKLLAHIRHCMRLMPQTITNTLQEALKKPELETFSTDTMYDIVISVFSNWRSWEMDDLRQCRLFSDVFERKRVTNVEEMGAKKESWLYEVLRYSSNSLQLSLGEFEAAIYDDQMENKMRVAGLEFIFESRYKADGLPQAGLFPGVPITNEANRLSTGFLDIAVKTGFKSAEIDVNPVIIAFTRHILRIERIFTPQFNKILESTTDKRPVEGRKSIENPSSPRQSIHLNRELTGLSASENEPSILEVIDRFDVVFNGMAVIETIRITLTAHNLSAQVIFSQIQVSALNFTKQRIFPKQDIESISVAKSSGSNPDGSASAKSGLNKLIASVAMNISSINSSLKERIYTKENAGSIPSKELLTFGIVGINSEVTLSQFTPAKKPKQTKVSVPREVINLLVTFKQVNFALPRSILKLYLFAKDWREENMQSFDFLFQGVMNEWEADRKSNQKPKAVTPSTPRELKIQIVLKTLTLESHMLPSLLFQYEAGDLMIMLHDVPPGLPFSAPQLTYTAQLLRQSVDFIANQQKSRGSDRSRLLEDRHAASFSLPVIRASGSVMNVGDAAHPVRTRRSSITALTRGVRHPKKLESSVSFDFVEMTLNVNMLDHILTAQSLLGAEANELIDILSNGNKATPTASPAVTQESSTAPDLLYSIKVSLSGLSIAAVSPTAVLYFESDLLKGVITNNPNPSPITPFPSEVFKSRLAWRLYAQSITLSLNHHAGSIRMGSRAEDIRARKLRLAYITINLNVQNFSPNTSDKDRFKHTTVSSFYVSFLKVHALMQPQAVSRIIGIYTYYEHELERRKELKAADMAKLADNTKRIIKSLEVDVPAYKDNTRSILEETEIFLHIDDVAVAIPLDRREDIMDRSDTPVEAFLISATSIAVLTKSGETSSGTLSHLCAQFVPRFDQAKDEHFRSRSHPKMNRLSFPNISCQVEATKESPGHQKILSLATVSGFELDIDPTIVRYVNTLSDVYDNSKGLVTSLNLDASSATAPSLAKPESQPFISTPKTETQPPVQSSTVIWKIENTFQCSKSVCRFYPKSYVAKLPKSSKFMESEPNFATMGSEVSGVDRFIIPGLSLWTNLRIPLGDNIAELQAAGPPRIHVEVNIHACENTFYPSLVPFFQDIVSGLKVGIRRQRQYSEPGIVPVAPSTAVDHGPQVPTVSSEVALAETVPKRQELAVTCYLFLEKTKIEFNCQPMAKVMSVLTFERGHILMSHNSDRSGNSSSTIAGTFGGASSDTHHIFSQDKGFKLETKGMIFNAVAETRRQAEVNKKTLSVTVDFRQIGVDFDLRQAEILVLMKMIWMDQANYLIRDGLTVSRSTSSSHGLEPSSASQSMGSSIAGGTSLVLASGKRESSFLGYNVFVMARLRQMRITGDLGSQIGKMDFKLDEVRLRTKLRPFHPRSASVSTGPLDLQFLPMERGWLEGYLVMDGVNLETLSKVQLHPVFPCSVMEVVMQTKRMTSMLS
ncbi:hypothetical protein BGZ52_011844, partial [Haplosporangium bisporale]